MKEQKKRNRYDLDYHWYVKVLLMESGNQNDTRIQWPEWAKKCQIWKVLHFHLKNSDKIREKYGWWWVCTHSEHVKPHFRIFWHLRISEIFSTIRIPSTSLHPRTPKCSAHISTISERFIRCPRITHQHISEYSTIIHTCITCCQNLRTSSDTHPFTFHHIPGTLYRISKHLPAQKHMYAKYLVLSTHSMQNIRNTFGNTWTPIQSILQHS